MDSALRQRLDNLPALDSRAGQAWAASCKLCGGRAGLFDVVDFQKHCSYSDQYSFGLSGIPVCYHRCALCGYLFTSFFDDWSTEEFARYIYNDDYVLVDPDYSGARPSRLAGILAKLLGGHEGLRILDYGAGSGIFAADMREAGFAATEAFDPFSSPDRPQGLFDIVTCFEALEHTTRPDHAIADMHAWLRPEGHLVFTQSVQPRDIAQIRGAWWYLAPRNGHISMFTIETLQALLPSPAHTLHGNGLLWIMAPPLPHPMLADCLTRIGPALMAASLRPPPHGDDESWYPAEPSDGGPFRWSRGEYLQWRLAPPPLLPARLQVRIPFTLEIEAGFASGCRVEIAGKPAEMVVAEGEIFAEATIEVELSDITVSLYTPAPRSPFEVSGAPDGRRLGLAMMTINS